jgi:hypothetical protein
MATLRDLVEGFYFHCLGNFKECMGICIVTS